MSPNLESVFCYVPIIYPRKVGKNLTTGSLDIMQPRKCDANRIRTKNNMSPSP